MSYISAEDVLPKELIETIQQYVSGKSIYIPCKEKKVWGSQTKTKQYYKIRNQEICIKHKNGAIRRVNVNIAATTVENYRKLKEAGIGTYILFQETYNKESYEKLHPTGPKHDYNYHTEKTWEKTGSQ